MNKRLINFLLRRCVPGLITLLGQSIRFTRVDERIASDRAARGELCIFCFWHNRFLLMPYVYQRIRGRKNICVMASLSKDGDYISAVLKGFGFELARGSSSRRGDAAIKELVSRHAAGLDTSITPDGPRGPVYKVQPGVILLSQMSGVPIVPISYDVTRKVRLRSWDRFIIPMPFSKGVLAFGDPLLVPPDADDNGREEARLRLEREMRSLDERAASMLGISAACRTSWTP